jgi:hypothetical protein
MLKKRRIWNEKGILYLWCRGALLFHREFLDFGLKDAIPDKLADTSTAADSQPETHAAEPSRAASCIFSGGGREDRTPLLIKNRPRDWSKERLRPLRLNKNWSVKLEGLFLIYLSYSLSDNLQPLLTLTVPQIVGTDFELYRRK